TVPNRRAFISMAASVLLATAKSAVTRRAMAQSTSLVGNYDGRQMEMAAGLELLANGRSHGHLCSQEAGLGVLGSSPSLFRIQGLSPFHDLVACCTRSSSHTVAACCGCTNIPRPAGGAQGGRDHSFGRLLRP